MDNSALKIHFSADFIEKKASSLGLENLFLLTTRTADWYALDILITYDYSNFFVVVET